MGTITLVLRCAPFSAPSSSYTMTRLYSLSGMNGLSLPSSSSQNQCTGTGTDTGTGTGKGTTNADAPHGVREMWQWQHGSPKREPKTKPDSGARLGRVGTRDPHAHVLCRVDVPGGKCVV